ncbi:MAG: hypothetical protein JJU42_07120 [Rhodobacteraceae bacterium]|nr:hypothetical protein [Paracoccaceae bacterium]
MQAKLEPVHVDSRPLGWNAASAQGAGRRSAWLASAMLDSERLEAVATEKLLYDGFEGMCVLLVGFSHADLCDTRQKLRSIGATATATASVAALRQREDVSDMRHGFTHAFVNLDAFESVDDAVDALIAFRSNAPELIVVAFSEAISGDDFGKERARICDATLRLPISAPRLRNGLVTAEMNHADTH